jgi:hypothetical protein
MTAIFASAGRRYFKLVRESPLRVIHSEEEYQRAVTTLDRLSDVGTVKLPTRRNICLPSGAERVSGDHLWAI